MKYLYLLMALYNNGMYLDVMIFPTEKSCTAAKLEADKQMAGVKTFKEMVCEPVPAATGE